MKLNLEIVYAGLEESVSAELMGVQEKKLHLGRPEYYMGNGQTFLSGHLYVVRGERLPPHPTIERGSAIVCLGPSMYLPYYLKSCGVIQIKSRTDRHLVFNLLTAIYNIYDEWCETLQAILNTSGNIREMVLCSQKIFGTPMFVLNAKFQILAYGDYSDIAPTEWGKTFQQLDAQELSLFDFSIYLEHAELATENREAMLINIWDSSTLCVNLFQGQEYSGCLIVDYRQRKYRSSDDALAGYLARMIELALRKYTVPSHGERGSMRQILQDLISGLQISLEQRWMLESQQDSRTYICTKIKFSSSLAQLPMDYMCSMIEKVFPDSIAFEYDGAMISFIETQVLEMDGEDCHQAFRERILPLISSMNFDMGVSDSFHDVHNARLYYLQASSALENGRLFAPAEHFHLFQDHALTELIVNALGRLPIEMYFSGGLRRLTAHDAASPVSYIQTLRTYLEKNMSITKTTAALYINRSTLLERIARIKRDLGTDLQDSDERLRLLILLKAMQIQDAMQTTNH